MNQLFQAGQLNTTALSVPGLYVQIVPPGIYLLNGVPTNVAGMVGTAAWGPVGVPYNVSAITDYVRTFGQPQNRKYDMGTHLMCANMQGAAAVYKMVRVTDGTDAAAAGTMSGGTAGTVATDTVTFTTNPAAGTLVLGGTTVTIVASGATGNQVNSQSTVALTAAALLTFLQNSSDVNISKCSYSLSGLVLTINYKTQGVAGNAFTVVTTITGATAAAATLLGGTANTQGVALTSIWTGTAANGDTAVLSAGTAAGSYKVVLTHPGNIPETFDNIGVGLSGNALFVAIAQAINSGIGLLRGPSQIMTAVAGAAVAAPTLGTTTLAGGSDGVATINGQTLLGSDTLPRKGMYALRAQGVSICDLCDCDDWTTWSTQIPFGLAEGIYMIGTTPIGDTPSNAAAVKALAGIDSYAMRIQLGDWIMLNDTINGLYRWVSPQGYVTGWLANASPQFSSLNKPLQGIVTTQKCQFGLTYATADLQTLAGAGIDVITNPIPVGKVFGEAIGRNTSSRADIHGDNYTRMTNYIASTLNAGMGIFVGMLQSIQPNDPTRNMAKTTLQAFMGALKDANMIDDFFVVLDLSNNPNNQIALGYMQAYVQVRYLAVVEYFIISLEGGQSVTITRSNNAPF